MIFGIEIDANSLIVGILITMLMFIIFLLASLLVFNLFYRRVMEALEIDDEEEEVGSDLKGDEAYRRMKFRYDEIKNKVYAYSVTGEMEIQFFKEDLKRLLDAYKEDRLDE